jgi:hypothetical protein
MANNEDIARRGLKGGSNLLGGIVGIWAPSAGKMLGQGIDDIGELVIDTQSNQSAPPRQNDVIPEVVNIPSKKR